MTIPSKVSTINEWTFGYCTNLESISIPESVNTICAYAFDGCTKLTDITLPSKLCSIEDYTFKGCSSLYSISIPSSVNLIGEHAFDGCKSLTSITIPDSTTEIGYKAFYGCSNLTSVTIPKSITVIGNDTFKNTSDTLTIYGYSNSYAEKYAKENQINFVSLDVTVSAVSIYQIPNKSDYNIGDSISLDGLVLFVEYSNGTSDLISEDYICDTYILSESGIQTVKVSYFGKTATFNVNVTDPTDYVPSIVVQSVQVQPGQEISVNIQLKNNPGIIATKIQVSYDSEKLSLVKISDGGLLGNGTMSADKNLSAIPYSISWDDSTADEDQFGNGILVTLTFAVNDNTKTEEIPICITYDQSASFNVDLDDISFTTFNGVIRLTERNPGDSDGDGLLTLKDVAVIKRYLVGGWDDQINVQNADVNNDGDVNLLDVAILKRYLTDGWEVELK